MTNNHLLNLSGNQGFFLQQKVIMWALFTEVWSNLDLKFIGICGFIIGTVLVVFYITWFWEEKWGVSEVRNVTQNRKKREEIE